MLDEFAMYLSRGLIKISPELLGAVKEYKEEMAVKFKKIEPNEAIPHQYITQACVLLKKY